jgi:hypothetical protein
MCISTKMDWNTIKGLLVDSDKDWELSHISFEPVECHVILHRNGCWEAIVSDPEGTEYSIQIGEEEEGLIISFLDPENGWFEHSFVPQCPLGTGK